MAQIKTNIVKIYLYRLLSEFWLIVPVLIPFFYKNNLTMTHVFIVQSSYMATMLILEIPSGYFSDRLGRRITLILGALFLPLGLTLYAFSTMMWQFICAEILLAVAASMRSGTDSALLYDSLQYLKKETSYMAKEGRADLFARIGSSSSSLAGGILGTMSLILPFYINIISGLLLVIISLTIKDVPTTHIKTDGNPFQGIASTIKFTAQHRGIRSVILYSSFIFSTGLISLWLYLKFYKESQLPLAVHGILFAAFGLLSGFGAAQSHKINKRLRGMRTFGPPILIGIILIVVSLFTGIIPSIISVCHGFFWGYTGPLVFDYINKRISSEIRATVLSINNMIGSLFFVITSPLIGLLSDRISLKSAFIVTGLYVTLGILCSMILLKRSRDA